MISLVSELTVYIIEAAIVVVGAMAMVMYELFSYIEKNTTQRAHRSSNNEYCARMSLVKLDP